MDYIKNCPKCERIQTYTTKGRLQKSILENWVCNLCSSVHTKKTYNDDIINNSVKLYEEGNSLSKIGKIVKIKRDNIKKILDIKQENLSLYRRIVDNKFCLLKLKIEDNRRKMKKFKNLIYIGIFFVITYICLEIF
jgi:ribosomal protein L37AE/L43A